jgi:hypothetical protein
VLLENFIFDVDSDRVAGWNVRSKSNILMQ